MIELEPTARGAGFKFVNKIVGGVILKEYIPDVEAGIREALRMEYPVIDVETTLSFGSYHEIDSSAMAFRIAGQMAFHEAYVRAEPVLLEPIMKVKVEVPQKSLGDVFDDIQLRRAKIDELEESLSRLRAIVPLSELLGYAAYIHNKTGGQGKVAMKFIGYDPVHTVH